MEGALKEIVEAISHYEGIRSDLVDLERKTVKLDAGLKSLDVLTKKYEDVSSQLEDLKRMHEKDSARCEYLDASLKQYTKRIAEFKERYEELNRFLHTKCICNAKSKLPSSC